MKSSWGPQLSPTISSEYVVVYVSSSSHEYRRPHRNEEGEGTSSPSPFRLIDLKQLWFSGKAAKIK